MGIRLLEIRKRLPIQVLHHQICNIALRRFGNAEISDIDNVGVTEAPAGLSFALEPGQKVRFGGPSWGDYFDGDSASGSQMSRQIDVSHTARAELLVNPVFGVENFT